MLEGRAGGGVGGVRKRPLSATIIVKLIDNRSPSNKNVKGNNSPTKR